MVYINRNLQKRLDGLIARGDSVLLLGPRQTGKTTLIKRFEDAHYISFIKPRVRQRYEIDPGVLEEEVIALAEDLGKMPLVILDEVQKVSPIMDVVQGLIDDHVAQFLLTGSSARKLRRGDNINLLPGRVISMHLDPLSILELPQQKQKLNDLLLYGSLPQIILQNDAAIREEHLVSYVSIYLEEEIRSEAVVRNLANFARFLELAASESGYTVNFSKLSQSIGVAHTTVKDYYQILEDCLIVERIEPLTYSKTRHKLSKAQKYIFFDLGVRRVAARDGLSLPNKYMGHLFEQFVGIELIRQSRISQERIKIKYWRDHNGPEVDWIIESPERLIPVEVKYTDRPNKEDAKHLTTFIQEYTEATKGYIVCRTPNKMKITENVYAIPWQQLHTILED